MSIRIQRLYRPNGLGVIEAEKFVILEIEAGKDEYVQIELWPQWASEIRKLAKALDKRAVAAAVASGAGEEHDYHLL